MKYMVAFLFLAAAVLLYGIWRFQEKVIFFPEKLPSDYHYDFGDLSYEEINIPTDNAILNGVLFKTDHPKGIILFFHGNAGSLRTWGWVAQELIRYNYDVFLYDYRGYGKSVGKMSEKALFADAETVYKTITQGYSKKVIYGRSIGSGIAIWLAHKENSDRLLLEAPFYNLQDLAKIHYPWFPSWMLRYHFRSDLYIKDIHCPVFIIHGDMDTLIPFSSSIKLTENSLTKMKLTLVKGGAHNDLSGFLEYKQWLMDSLN